jgi:hypothetical protein
MTRLAGWLDAWVVEDGLDILGRMGGVYRNHVVTLLFIAIYMLFLVWVD